MEKVVELTEKELETMVQNKARIEELHVGGTWLLCTNYVLYFPCVNPSVCHSLDMPLEAFS